jgi:hypothetical protein
MIPMTPAQKCKKLSRWLAHADPDWALGGCADMSVVIHAFCQREGIPSRVVCGIGFSSRSKTGTPHAWLEIAGSRFDPTADVFGFDFHTYEEKLGMTPENTFGIDSDTDREWRLEGFSETAPLLPMLGDPDEDSALE